MLYDLAKIGTQEDMTAAKLPETVVKRPPRAVPATGPSVQRMNPMPSVGERIKRRRTELGWTQDLLATKAGVSKNFLSDLENGKRKLGADTLYDIARALSSVAHPHSG